MYYFGDNSPDMVLLNPETGEKERINLPGSPTNRITPIYYDNNIYKGNDTGYEGFKSYAVAIVNYVTSFKRFIY